MTQNNRSLTPLQAMTKTSLESEIDNFLSASSEQIIEIDPVLITNWQYSDRPEFELGDIEALAEEFRTIGQHQPCIVRPISESSAFQYELIAGERRWRAAILARIPLKVIVKKLSIPEAAILQISENESRKDLSDYAKGLSYYKLISDSILSQTELVHKLGKTKQYVSSLLSFAKIPEIIIKSIGDMSKVSYRTAEEICRLSRKGPAYITAIIKVADKIRTGKFGQESLNTFASREVEHLGIEQIEKSKFFNKEGKVLFSVKFVDQKIQSITLSEFVSTHTEKHKKEITGELINVIEKYLNKSAAAD